jgi:putative transposase
VNSFFRLLVSGNAHHCQQTAVSRKRRDKMTRPLRHIPQGHLVEVTCRTIQGRYLLRPTPLSSDIILGVIGRAQRLYNVEIHSLTFLSSHMHLLLSPQDAWHLARFMNHVNGNIAKKIGSLVGWQEKFWSRRYRAVVVSDEEAAQLARLRYHLAQGCKEGLVASPMDWPGASSTTALLEGSMQLQGHWYKHTKAETTQKRGAKLFRQESAEPETVLLTPLPCWRHLPPSEYRRRVADLVAGIEQETTEVHQQAGTTPAGALWVMRQDPHTRPKLLQRSPAPAFHAATQKAYRLLKVAYSVFLAAYRAAAERLRRGEQGVAFPAGCFPPALPFVPIVA